MGIYGVSYESVGSFLRVSSLGHMYSGQKYPLLGQRKSPFFVVFIS
jgi:hypothetical protein